jgi:hypothetical protein
MRFGLNLSPRVEDSESFYRSGELFAKGSFIFFHVKEKGNLKTKNRNTEASLWEAT